MELPANQRKWGKVRRIVNRGPHGLDLSSATLARLESGLAECNASVAPASVPAFPPHGGRVDSQDTTAKALVSLSTGILAALRLLCEILSDDG